MKELRAFSGQGDGSSRRLDRKSVGCSGEASLCIFARRLAHVLLPFRHPPRPMANNINMIEYPALP
jgi:hypothetical protein